MSFGSKMWTKDKLRFVLFGGSIIKIILVAHFTMIQVIARSPFISCLDSKCFNKKILPDAAARVGFLL